MATNDSSAELDRDKAGSNDAGALTRTALEHTRQVLHDSSGLLDRARHMPQPDDRGDSATLDD